MTRARTFRFAVALVAVAGLLVLAAPAEGYRMIKNTSIGRVTSGSMVSCSSSFTHWTEADTYWYLNTSGQGSGKAGAVQAAMNAWTNVPYARHVLHYSGTTGAGWSTDGKNTLLWASGNGCTGTCLALTALVLQSGQRIVESDVTFNSNYTWTTNGANYDTQAVATHELGHALGIHHTNAGSSPTMYAYYSVGWRTLESDDRAALQCSQDKYPVGLTCEEQCDWEYEQCWDQCLSQGPGSREWEYCVDDCEEDYWDCITYWC